MGRSWQLVEHGQAGADSWVDRAIGARVGEWLVRGGLPRSSVSEISLILPLAGAGLLLTGPSVLRGLVGGGLMLLGHLLDVGARHLPQPPASADWVTHLTRGVRSLVPSLVLVAVAVGISQAVPVLAVVALALALASTVEGLRVDPGPLYLLVLIWGLTDAFGPLFLALAVVWVAGTFRESPQVAGAVGAHRWTVPTGGDETARSFGATVRTFRY